RAAGGGGGGLHPGRPALRDAVGAGGGHCPAHRRPRAAVPDSRRSPALGRGAVRAGLHPAGPRAAAAPAPGRVLDEEPGVLHREGPAPSGIRAGGGPRRRRRAHRGLLPRGGLDLTDRTARIALGVVTALLVALVWRVELTQFWGDGATYHSMAWSLAEDGDLRYEARDVFRVRREISTGPQGIFLKRASGGLRWDGAGGFPWIRRVSADDPRIYFAKPFAYPVAAAPLVKLF